MVFGGKQGRKWSMMIETEKSEMETELRKQGLEDLL
jgi:hypothetical protein